MSTLTRKLIEAGYRDRVFNDRQMARGLGAGDASRYGLVNRALKDGSLNRVRRGLYTMGPEHRKLSLHPFVIAQALLPGSYVSFETALSYHGLIPEAVYTAASVHPGRKTLVQPTDQFGQFSFHPLALEDFRFMVGVDRVALASGAAFIAQPLRALMDLVAQRRVKWTGPDWIEQGLRIAPEDLTAFGPADFSALKGVYKHRQTRDFLEAFEKHALGSRARSNDQSKDAE